MLVILFFSTGICVAQQQSKHGVKPDPRLYDCFEKSYVDGLQSNLRLLHYYNFYLDHSYFISDMPEKPVEWKDISTLALRNPGPNGETLYFSENPAQVKTGTFNPLRYDISLQPTMFTNYLLGKTGKILVFYSNKAFNDKFNDYMKSLNTDLEK